MDSSGEGTAKPHRPEKVPGEAETRRSCAGDPRVRGVMGERGRPRKSNQRGGRGRSRRGGPKPHLAGAREGSERPEQSGGSGITQEARKGVLCVRCEEREREGDVGRTRVLPEPEARPTRSNQPGPAGPVGLSPTRYFDSFFIFVLKKIT
jgi:hypothetical protein